GGWHVLFPGAASFGLTGHQLDGDERPLDAFRQLHAPSREILKRRSDGAGLDAALPGCVGETHCTRHLEPLRGVSTRYSLGRYRSFRLVNEQAICRDVRPLDAG